ncbi:MAG TPA: hypothetical protein H9955_03980 [Candidatus Mediterraneibacter cottocaccae]|nr:hypothetical protein [Candidatus Mediterraneibacter cottocaccae]
MKKIILTTVGIIAALLAVFAVVVVIQVVKDFQQEDDLREEISQISELLVPGSEDSSEIADMLRRTVTTGDYAKVEKAIKSYLSDTLECYSTIDENLYASVITNALTTDTYRTDGPYFLQTRASLSQVQASLSESIETLARLQTEDALMSYINRDTEIDSYYRDFYREIVGENMPSGSDIDRLTKDISDVLDLITKEQNVLVFLSDHSGEWMVYGNELYFTTDELIEEYTDLILQIE